MNKNDEKTMVRMQNLCGAEYLMYEGQAPRRVIENIWLRIRTGQVWAIYALTPYEAALLLQIMANVHPYEDGRCVLAERGMMRKKRVILPHVFYIGSADMMYDTMNVLEYLMFATAKQRTKPAARQERLFEWLIECGLGDLLLTEIRWLDAEEKAIVILMAAAFAQSGIVVFNMPQLEFNENLLRAFAHISSRMREDGKALILSTTDARLIQSACTHAAFLAHGHILFQGSVDGLRAHFDVYTVRIEADEILEERLRESFREYRLDRKNDGLYICGRAGETPQEIFRNILDSGIVPLDMKVHQKTVKNALGELAHRHGLS